MSTIQTQEIVERLRAGKLGAADGAELETLAMQAIIQELRTAYPVVFQERRIRQKYEIGLAARSAIGLELKKIPHELFPLPILSAKLRKCVFVSGYNDVVSGLTAAASVRVSADPRRTNDVILRIGRGFKFDRFPDGWELKPMAPTATRLSKQFLKSRGWQFEAMSLFGGKP